MKEETGRIEPEINPELNYILPLLVGLSILMIYFVLFAFNMFDSIISNEIYLLLHGEFNEQYIALKDLVLVALSSFVLVFSLTFLIIGLRKMKKTRKKKQDRRHTIFNIFFVGIMSITLLIAMLDAVGFYHLTYIGSYPVFGSWGFIRTVYFFNLTLFPVVIILVGIQSFLLRKKMLYDQMKVKRLVTPYIMLISLLVWFVFMNTYIIPGTTVSATVALSGYASSQLSTSLLAAGVYLELVIRIDNSN